MRTNIVIDEALMSKAMLAGGYKTKKEAVEAGLELLARQAAYREVRKWRGKLQWTDHDYPWPGGLMSNHTVQAPKHVYGQAAAEPLAQ